MLFSHFHVYILNVWDVSAINFATSLTGVGKHLMPSYFVSILTLHSEVYILWVIILVYTFVGICPAVRVE